ARPVLMAGCGPSGAGLCGPRLHLPGCCGEGRDNMRTWADVGINLPYGTTGEIRTPCPQCSTARGRERDACLSIHVERGLWYCHYCGWKGSLHGCSQALPLTRSPRPSVQPHARNYAAIGRVWRESSPVTADDPVITYLHQRGIALPLAALSP